MTREISIMGRAMEKCPTCECPICNYEDLLSKVANMDERIKRLEAHYEKTTYAEQE